MDKPIRLPFRLPDFTRTIWASDALHELWGERVRRISTAWSQIERWSVVDGVRPSALQVVSPEALPELSAWAAEHGIVALPLGQIGAADAYSSTVTSVEAGKPWNYRIALCHPDVAARWPGADDAEIGKLLGFPACCNAFFERVWVQDAWRDTTWPMFEGSDGDASGPPESNILLRWLGIRLVPHLPCSFRCEATVELGERLAAVGEAHGYAEEIAWTREMLAWPIEWSALHGIAEIRTPVVKVSAMTDATAGKHTVQRRGEVPEGAPNGTVFPHHQPALVQLKMERRMKTLEEIDPRTWEDNGFSGLDAMNAAHDVLLAAAHELEAGDHLIDLGCGNGRLLERFGEAVPGLTLSGVEIDPDRVERAKKRLPDATVKHGDLCACAWPKASHALLMPGRLVEKDSEKLRAWLAGRTLIVYAYGDWLDRFGDLAGLCSEVGIELTREVAAGDGVAVGVGALALEAAHA